ncbi:DUF4238 domain-containing protein [Halomonas sp. KG2]|uniref:DUF4238 domain-containing protein n=1 Tax=Halomonas sp. KG2 TaxID=2951138 RepID=UPI00406D1B0F
MSGRKQHYIPQSFQRGFCIPGKKNQTNVYSRTKHYISNINNIAAQRDFYSAPSPSGEKTLDDSITFYENKLGNLLHSLRSLEIGDTANPQVSAEIIAHLAPRTNSKWLCKSYRVTFSVIITYVFDRFTELVERTVGCQR